MDFNKLIKDIIKAAREDATMCVNDQGFSIGNTRLITTLKLEVKVSTDSSYTDDEVPRNSTKMVLLTINDQ